MSAKRKTVKRKPAAQEPEKTQEERLREVGASAMSCIREMVAALECDYDRLEELRDSKDIDEDEDGKRTISDEELKELADLEAAAGDCESREDAEQRIHEDPLSLEVRSGWHEPGAEGGAEEYCLLLGTGGPAVRIIGDLDGGEPTSANLQTQDWFTPWTDYATSNEDDEALMTYVRCFYFGS